MIELISSWRPQTLTMFFVIFMALISCGVRAHDDDVHTVQYNDDNFDEEVAKNNHFVMFYAPWCGYCKRLAPTWEQLAETLNNEVDTNILIGKVDCTTDNAVCTRHDVTGYPTLKFFKKGEQVGVKFKGTRDLPTLSAFINEQLGSSNDEISRAPKVPEPVGGLVELTEDNFDKFVSEGKHFVKFYAPWCGHCQKLAPTWEELAQSMSHDNSVSVAKVDCTVHRSVCSQFDVKGYPTLLWIEDGKKVDKYQGQRTHEELKSYVSKMLGSETVASTEDGTGADATASSAILTLTGTDFSDGIAKGISFVKFFVPWCGHCKRLAPIWEELAKKFISHEHVHIVNVDCTLENTKQLCSDQEIYGYPTLYLYSNGKKIDEYTGTRSLEDLHEFVVKHSTSHDEL